MDGEPTISVVVGTRNRPLIYQRFIQSVLSSASVPTQVVVGDATQEHCYAESIRGNLVDVCVLRENPPLGMLRGYNRCFKHCRGEYVAWFNEDCELLDGWDVAALSFMRRHDEVGLGAIYFRDRLEDGSYTKFQVYSYPFSIPHANFGFLKRSLGDELGWFDERLGWGYGSDSALSLQVIDHGLAVARIPHCKCIHHRAWDAEMSKNHAEYRMHDLAKFKGIWPFSKTFKMSLEHLEKYGHILGPQEIE